MMRLQGIGKKVRAITLAATQKKRQPLADADLFLKDIRDAAQGMSDASEETDINDTDNYEYPEIDIMIQELASENDEPCREIQLPTIKGVPDIWPNVPLLPLRRYPLYPYFLDKIELTNPLMMDLIRHKIQQHEPYVGAFLTKSDQAAEFVFNLDELYTIGAFAEVKSIKDYGHKLSLVITAHRRIEIINAQTSPLPPLEQQLSGAQTLAQLKDNDSSVPEPLLHVNIKNYPEQSYRLNKNIKTLVNLVHEQLNELIGMNPAQKHILEKLICENRNLLTDPVYVCDLSASLTLGYRQGMQEIMEEKDISQRLLLTLSLLKKECKDSC